ncbi:hypothetical protein GCK32_002745 [Trichostrongylus colubriformis]|uniref:Uncharacterized protein n=1 Tax=Trichostrongylus colubriformis TaxID=6319 RepID=A0AAN8J334_TRICO
MVFDRITAKKMMFRGAKNFDGIIRGGNYGIDPIGGIVRPRSSLGSSVHRLEQPKWTWTWSQPDLIGRIAVVNGGFLGEQSDRGPMIGCPVGAIVAIYLTLFDDPGYYGESDANLSCLWTIRTRTTTPVPVLVFY